MTMTTGDALGHALRGAQHLPQPELAPLQRLLVVGAGGTLGSAVLAEALVPGRFAQVQALVAEELTSVVRGFVPLRRQDLARGGLAASAVLVFERQRHSNGRDDAFVMPAPHELLPLAQALHTHGVQRLVVVVPHAPALLPQALAQGFASLDEGAVAALGFSHLVFLRAAQAAGARGAAGSRLQRFAAWWLSQLGWMVPQRQQALRAAALARAVVALAQVLPQQPAGTRVVAPELLWQWTQERADGEVPQTPRL
jgi:hypothetical protein